MAVKYQLVLAFGLILAITWNICESTSTNQTEVVEPTIAISNSTVNEANKTKRTCACEDTDSPVCASNGITYKNSCRFDCAKARVTRLRKIRNGQCVASAGSSAYWNRKSIFN